MFKELWNGLAKLGDTILSGIMFLLPDSPFSNLEIPQEVRNIFGYVNYFVPVRAMLLIGSSWLSAIGIYYIYQAVLRRVNAIK